MNPASPRPTPSGTWQPVSPRKSKINAAPSSEVQRHSDAGSEMTDVADLKIQKEARRKEKTQNRKNACQGQIQKMAKGVTQASGDVIDMDKNHEQNDHLCFNSDQETQFILQQQDALAGSLQGGHVAVSNDPPSPEVDMLVQPVSTQFDQQTAPVKYNVVSLGHINPGDFYNDFKASLDAICRHKRPQHLNVGMTFARLTQSVLWLNGSASAQQIGICIDSMSDYLLPSISSMFHSLEKQLIPGATLNITAGFKSGLLEGLMMFDQSWQRQNAAAMIADVDYQGRSLFDQAGPAAYLEHQWSELDRKAKFVGATVVILD